MISTLIGIFILLAIVGLILWGVGQIPGIPQIVKTMVYVIVGVILLLYVWQQIGGGPGLNLSLRR
jgi:hypothetical protein